MAVVEQVMVCPLPTNERRKHRAVNSWHIVLIHRPGVAVNDLDQVLAAEHGQPLLVGSGGSQLRIRRPSAGSL